MVLKKKKKVQVCFCDGRGLYCQKEEEILTYVVFDICCV